MVASVVAIDIKFPPCPEGLCLFFIPCHDYRQMSKIVANYLETSEKLTDG
jgi:hypothetical protein